MDLLLFLKSLLKRVLGVVQVPLLILVLLLNIRINFSILHWLRSDVRVKVLIDNSLQLVEVIDVLDNPVNGILEALDEDIVGSNLCSVLFDQILHVLLSGSELIHNITKIGIDLVVSGGVDDGCTLSLLVTHGLCLRPKCRIWRRGHHRHDPIQ